jgi:hypothetical protein
MKPEESYVVYFKAKYNLDLFWCNLHHKTEHLCFSDVTGTSHYRIYDYSQASLFTYQRLSVLPIPLDQVALQCLATFRFGNLFTLHYSQNQLYYEPDFCTYLTKYPPAIQRVTTLGTNTKRLNCTPKDSKAFLVQLFIIRAYLAKEFPSINVTEFDCSKLEIIFTLYEDLVITGGFDITTSYSIILKTIESFGEDNEQRKLEIMSKLPTTSGKILKKVLRVSQSGGFTEKMHRNLKHTWIDLIQENIHSYDKVFLRVFREFTGDIFVKVTTKSNDTKHVKLTCSVLDSTPCVFFKPDTVSDEFHAVFCRRSSYTGQDLLEMAEGTLKPIAQFLLNSYLSHRQCDYCIPAQTKKPQNQRYLTDYLQKLIT